MTRGIEFGFATTAVDAPGASDAELYASLLAECELNRSLGFTTAWALEHHFSDYFPTPDVLLLLANIAPRFPDLALGVAGGGGDGIGGLIEGLRQRIGALQHSLPGRGIVRRSSPGGEALQ